jgi:hypothetical protein
MMLYQKFWIFIANLTLRIGTKEEKIAEVSNAHISTYISMSILLPVTISFRHYIPFWTDENSFISAMTLFVTISCTIVLGNIINAKLYKFSRFEIEKQLQGFSYHKKGFFQKLFFFIILILLLMLSVILSIVNTIFIKYLIVNYL